MKKILGLLLSIMLILSLTACLEKPSSNTESSQTQSSVTSKPTIESGNANSSVLGNVGLESAEVESEDIQDSESDSEEFSYSWEDDGFWDSDDDGVIETPYI